MRSRRGKSGAPPCVVVDDNGREKERVDITVCHQWHARNVHGFIIKWYVCEYCGLTMHELPTNNTHYSDYEFIPAYTIEEMPA